MSLSDVRLYGLIALCLVAGEGLLELRAERRGFGTLVGDAMRSGQVVETTVREIGPTEGFPFRNRVIAPDAATRPVIWIGSASYAEDDRYDVDEVFPAQAQQFLADSFGIEATILNASRGGNTAATAERDLRQFGSDWSPDYAVLYHMTNDLHGLARTTSFDPIPEGPASQGWDLLGRLYERTTLYNQLRANFTPEISRHRLLPDTLHPAADSAFLSRVRAFTATAAEVGAQPVLVTFAVRHGEGEPPSPETTRWMLRWNPALSPRGYLATLYEWNELMRHEGAKPENEIIEVSDHVSGRAELFRDPVHFLPDGHAAVGFQLAEGLARIIRADVSR